MAKAPAETMGGIPASKIATSTASLCRPPAWQTSQAVSGGDNKFNSRPIESENITFPSNQERHLKAQGIITNDTKVAAKMVNRLTASGG